MITPEVTELIGVIDIKEEFSTYDANEHFPDLTTQRMGSILKADERIVNLGKKWHRTITGYAHISIWEVIL